MTEFSFNRLRNLVLMKRFSTTILSLALCYFTWAQVGTSPLEYNPDKFYQTHGSMVDDVEMQVRNLYPACDSSHFYTYDTLSLPFIDDFSHNHFGTHYSWEWPNHFDSTARIYRLIPDTIASPNNLIKYSYTQTRHYTLPQGDTINNIDSSIINIPRMLITYGNCENPFIAVDTETVWIITSQKYYWDTLTLHVNATLYSVDGTLDGDTTHTVQVYTPIPNNNYWIDNFTYRNTSMGINPPTYGVVTFDGTNELGKPYSPGASTSYGVADYLTSKPIHLGGYTAADNIYLSFFSQPQGLGYEPDEHDSLVLEFYSPVTEKWHHAWSSIGDTLPGTSCRPFIQSIIPVNDTLFLKEGFQFRFKNYGNLSGNIDHWNLDYVRLDTNRSASDTLIEDVAFVFLPPTILYNYTSMPYHQFLLPNRNNKWNNYLSNLFNANKTINYTYDFTAENGTLLNQYPTDYSAPPVTGPILPYHPNGYSTFAGWSEPDFNYNFTTSIPTCCPFPDSARFYIKHYFDVTGTDKNPENDSIVLRQDFLNYYSYDDGSAEQAVWLGTPGYMTVKFTSNFPDTLRGIQIYYSPIKDIVTSRFIMLQVYTGNLNGSPVYQSSRQIGVLDQDPNTTVNTINNGYTTYLFTDTNIIIPAGDFFVGWYQNQTFKINVGFDKNLDNKSRTYYRTSGQWDTLALDGTVMIRPLVGRPLDKQDIGVEENWNDHSITLFPNPANDLINFRTSENIHLSGIRIIDIAGKLVYSSNTVNVQQVDISQYSPGIYFMQFISSEAQNPVTKKFIVSH